MNAQKFSNDQAQSIDTNLSAAYFLGNSHRFFQLFSEIEYCLAGCVNQLGIKNIRGFFSNSKNDSEFSDMSNFEAQCFEQLDSFCAKNQSMKKTRIRRSPEELESQRTEVCPYSGCGKAYTSKCSLYLHIKRNHKDEISNIYENSKVTLRQKVKKGVDVNKVFKNVQVLDMTENPESVVYPQKFDEKSKTTHNSVFSDIERKVIEIKLLKNSDKKVENNKKDSKINYKNNSFNGFTNEAAMNDNESKNIAEDCFEIINKQEASQYSHSLSEVCESDRKISSTSTKLPSQENSVSEFGNFKTEEKVDIDFFTRQDKENNKFNNELASSVFDWSDDDSRIKRSYSVDEFEDFINFDHNEMPHSQTRLFDFENELNNNIFYI